MKENLFETQYDVTKKTKIKRFYEKNKILIFSSIFILLIAVASYTFYLDKKEKKKVILSDNYIKAKIYLHNGNKNEAINMLKTIISANDSTYSTLSLFLLLDENLISDKVELTNLFNHVIQNHKSENEIKNLIIFKKALYQSNFVNEKDLIESLKPLINKDTIWKPHVLLLIGDYFFSKKEYLKAKEFYMEILLLKNLHKEFYDHAKSHLVLVSND